MGINGVRHLRVMLFTPLIPRFADQFESDPQNVQPASVQRFMASPRPRRFQHPARHKLLSSASRPDNAPLWQPGITTRRRPAGIEFTQQSLPVRRRPDRPEEWESLKMPFQLGPHKSLSCVVHKFIVLHNCCFPVL